MGSISKVVDTTTGAIAAEYSYDSYGGQITHAASLFQHNGYTARAYETPVINTYRAQRFLVPS